MTSSGIGLMLAPDGTGRSLIEDIAVSRNGQPESYLALYQSLEPSCQ